MVSEWERRKWPFEKCVPFLHFMRNLLGYYFTKRSAFGSVFHVVLDAETCPLFHFLCGPGPRDCDDGVFAVFREIVSQDGVCLLTERGILPQPVQSGTEGGGGGEGVCAFMLCNDGLLVVSVRAVLVTRACMHARVEFVNSTPPLCV